MSGKKRPDMIAKKHLLWDLTGSVLYAHMLPVPHILSRLYEKKKGGGGGAQMKTKDSTSVKLKHQTLDSL